MTDFCEFTQPTGDCYSVASYIASIIESAQLLPRIKYATNALDADDDSLTALWLPCDPPDCAIVVWFNTTSELYTVWSYISGTWRSTGSTGQNTPYYTEFEGVGGPIQEGWLGDWILDGEGNVHPTPVLSGEELLQNPDFEDWTLATIPDDWTSTVGTISEENTNIVSGSSSAHGLLTGAGIYNADLNQNITVSESLWFKLSAYMYGPSTLTVNSGLTSASNWINTSIHTYTQYLQWEKLVSTDFSVTTTGRARLSANSLSVNVNVYWDNASYQQIIDGYQITKEFYSAYGTFYVDFVKELGTQFGILLNYQDDNNYAIVVASTVRIYLVEVNAGLASITNSWVYTYVANTRLEVLRDSADNVTIDYNSINVVTNQALANPLTATIHGIVGTSELSYASAYGYTPE